VTITITAVPESMTRGAFIEWLASVGLDASELRSVHIDRSGIKATVFARNAEGKRFAHPNADEMATHEVHIRLDD
jgi:hypothetical protein